MYQHNSKLTTRSTLYLSLLVCSTWLTPANANDAPSDLEQQQLEVAGLYVDLMKDMPKSVKLINSPFPQAHETYGVKGKIDHNSIIKGGKALRIKVGRGGKRSYSKGSSSKTIGDIKQGDTLCLTFWARSINRPEDNLIAEFASLGVQQAGEPYRKLMDESTQLTHDWAQYSFKSIASQSLATGQAEVFFHFGHLKQRFEIGPTYLFNLAQNVDPNFKSNACGK